MHLNPNFREPVKSILSNLQNIHLLEPLEYPQFVHLMSMSTLILTDSGGLQEEAPSIGKPLLVLRNNTERTESLNSKNSIITGTNNRKIIKYAEKLINNKIFYKKMSIKRNIFGDGKAYKKIIYAISKFNYEKI